MESPRETDDDIITNTKKTSYKIINKNCMSLHITHENIKFISVNELSCIHWIINTHGSGSHDPV